MNLALEARAVAVAGITPMGLAVVVGVGRDRVAFSPRTVRFDQVVEADESGAARFELPDDQVVPDRSVWAVVDLATGSWAVAAPKGAEVRLIGSPARGLGAAARFLDQDGRRLDVLLVRPESTSEGAEAAGFWGLRVGDGGVMDSDQERNHRLSLRFTDLVPLGDSPPAPEELVPKDVLVGVDSVTLEIYAVQLAAPPSDGGNP
jgi:hypothetical protein